MFRLKGDNTDRISEMLALPQPLSGWPHSCTLLGLPTPARSLSVSLYARIE